LSILSSSYRTVLAFDGGHLIGLITAISDGVASAHITFLEVLASYRRRGIGSELVTRMLSELADLYAVDVMCDADLVSFYERFGLTPLVGMARRVPENL
jgi:ribosomal protein S18 acetylase RimI-like enzyme